MKPIDFEPKREWNAQKVMIAEKQEGYKTLPAAVFPEGSILTLWEPSEEERAALIRGESLQLWVWSYNSFSPVQIRVNGVAYEEDNF